MAKDPYKYFRIEARELVDGLTRGVVELKKGPAAPESVARLLRLAHTLKGAARVVKQPKIAESAHAVEDALGSKRETGAPLSEAEATEILRVLDDVSSRLDGLEPTPAAAQAPGSQPVTTEEPLDTLRVELDELDALSRSVGEAGVQMSAVRRGVTSLGHATDLVGLLAGHLAAKPQDNGAGALVALGRARAVVEDLRAAIDSAQRGLDADVERVGSELAEVSEITHRLRLVPAQTIFSALERAVRDATQALGKQVELETSGGDVRLDANVLSTLRDALMHVVRNAVAHGIEPESGRVASGKSPRGTIRVAFERRGNRVVVKCSDDGQGIDVDAVKRAATARGLISSAEATSWSLERALAVLQLGGLSTSAGVTELAGRGIGLDVVRSAASRLKGTFAIKSEPGRGVAVHIEVPVSVASLQGLLVEASGQLAAIPLDSVRETLRIRSSDIAQTADKSSVISDGKVLPFLPLDRALKRATGARARSAWSAVVIDSPRGRLALGVDRLVGTSNIVMRALPIAVQADPVVSGASLDSEGNPQLVLDPEGLVAALDDGLGIGPEPEEKRPDPVLIVDDSLTTRMLEQSILESAGYAVELAVSAEDGLAKARERHFSLFVVDVEMPGMDGFEFVAQTRADPVLRETPAILVTSRNAPEDKRRGEQVGARAYIVKSEFDQGRLLETIRGLIG